jgi:hypothetical protein
MLVHSHYLNVRTPGSDTVVPENTIIKSDKVVPVLKAPRHEDVWGTRGIAPSFLT